MKAKLKSIEHTSIAQEHRFTALITNMYKYFVNVARDEAEEDLRKKQLAMVSSTGTWVIRYARRRLWILGGRSLISFVSYALANGAIAVDSTGTPLPEALQKPELYE